MTILGIILFLRLGYVTGGAGVARALVILAVANIITVISSLSLAAIATNIKVKSGGDYYLISRTLGYKFGGSLGIVLYLAQSVSVAFYCIGFGEAVAAMTGQFPPAVPAVIAVGVLFIFVWLGADWATRFQYVVMFLLILALGSFYLGGIEQWRSSVFLANWNRPAGGPDFWLLFALFFPAVTGFTQGVSMSGDLRDSGRSLPLGTFLAVGISILVYLSAIIVFAGVLPNTVLSQNYRAMHQVASYGFLIDAGVIAATLSSAMASFLGGPRILQSLAADRIFPILSFLAKGAGETNNPRRCIILTCIIALSTISLGQLNLIAQVVSMFFLISYGLLNYATYYEADIGSASFRPRFRFFNKYLSLAGCILCLGVLLKLDLGNGMLALFLMFCIYLYLRNSGKPSRWADSSRSHAFSRVRRNLQQMAELPEHQNDWYPHLLAFTNHRETRDKLLHFGNWICGDTGIMNAVRIVITHDPVPERRRKEVLDELREDIIEEDIPCYYRAIFADDFSRGLSVVLQAHGVGPLQGNTVLANWYSSGAGNLSGIQRMKYSHNLRAAFRAGYNLVIFHCDDSKWESLLNDTAKSKRIDIWWKDDDDSSRLMLLFAFLATRNSLWKDAEIRVLADRSAKHFINVRDNLQHLFEEARIPAEPEVVEEFGFETVLDYSCDSSLVFMPFRINKSRITDVAGYSLERVLPQLPPAAMVMAAEEIDLDSEPEEGQAADLARAMDDLYDVEKHLRRVEKEQKRTEKRLEKSLSSLEEARSDPLTKNPAQDIAALEKAVEEAETEKDKLFRRAAKARTRLDDLIDLVKSLGGDSEADERHD